MNKYIVLFAVLAIIIAGGIGYRSFLLSADDAPISTGVVREITVIARKDQWRFNPETFEVARGDKIILTAVNEDEYDHGLAIDAFGISQRMPAKSTIKTEFVVTQEGDFPFYCSVPCGEGVVDGVKRTHFDMIGTIHVREMIGK